MKLSLSGRKLIQRHSGYRVNAYQGRNGVWMVGYASIRWPNGNLVKEGDKVMDELEAQGLFDYSIQSAERIVNSHISARLTQNQYDALVSLVYDVKGKNFNDSGIVEALNSDNMDLAMECWTELGQWHLSSLPSGCKYVDDIRRRRYDEKQVFWML